ncbi:MAG: M50 family metallopeptidase [bacterium]|nr:M50 family metallopeptidase [bacterium]
MKRFFRWIFWGALALGLLPACWGGTVALLQNLVPVVFLPGKSLGGFLLTGKAWAFLGGGAVYVLWHRLWPPHFLYTFVHEMTHLIFAVPLGKKVRSLEVNREEGAVVLSGTNPVITLAPYFFPLPAALLLGAGKAAEWAVPDPRLELVTAFAVGLALVFHLMMTGKTLRTSQPDLRRSGRLFSWVAIYLAGLVFMGGCAILALAGWERLAILGPALLDEIAAAYAWSGARLLEGVKWGWRTAEDMGGERWF